MGRWMDGWIYFEKGRIGGTRLERALSRHALGTAFIIFMQNPLTSFLNASKGME